MAGLSQFVLLGSDYLIKQADTAQTSSVRTDRIAVFSLAREVGFCKLISTTGRDDLYHDAL